MAAYARGRNASIGHYGEVRAAEWRPELGLVPNHVAADVPAQNYLDGVLLQDVVTESGLIVAKRGTPVEIKTVALRKVDGDSTRRGDVHVRKHAHEWLLANAGEYIIVVYDEASSVGDVDPEEFEVHAIRMLPAGAVDGQITTWCRGGSDKIARIPWSRLMDPDRVEGGDPA